MMKCSNNRLFVLALLAGVGLSASVASAQTVVVGAQQRMFEKYGDGSTGPDSVPCCFVTPMNPVATVDNRVIPVRGGAFYAEFKNKTAMVGNLFGFGTPAVLNGDGPAWYARYNPVNGGVVIPRGQYTSMASLMLNLPGGNLRRLTTMLDRTVFNLDFRPNQGPGTFMYNGSAFPAGRPIFRAASTWQPYLFWAGRLNVTPGPNRFGGTRAIFHRQFSTGVDAGTVPGLGNRFFFPVANGTGMVFTPMNVVRRETQSATFAVVTLATPMAVTGMTVGVQGLGTGWFTILPYTTGMVQALANTIGTPIMDFTTRADTGFENINVTLMGGITGQLQLVSGHLLQSRGGINTNLAGTNMTRITFTPEPASAALLGAGALGLIGLIVRDRRRSQV